MKDELGKDLEEFSKAHPLVAAFVILHIVMYLISNILDVVIFFAS